MAILKVGHTVSFKRGLAPLYNLRTMIQPTQQQGLRIDQRQKPLEVEVLETIVHYSFQPHSTCLCSGHMGYQRAPQGDY